MKKPTGPRSRPPQGSRPSGHPQGPRTPAPPPPPRSNAPFEIMLEAMANGGASMGFYQRQPVFIPYTIPGERVLARLVEDQGRFARAEGVTLLDASADRVFPVCPHFGPGKCGPLPTAAPALEPNVLFMHAAGLLDLLDAPPSS